VARLALTIAFVQILDMASKTPLLKNIVVKLVPVADCRKLRAREFCQWMESQSIDVQKRPITESYQKHGCHQGMKRDLRPLEEISHTLVTLARKASWLFFVRLPCW
jgi:hypothetical protein